MYRTTWEDFRLENRDVSLTRRDFIKDTSKIAAGSAVAATALSGSALAASSIPNVHLAQGSTINIVLIGCGGRGSGAAADALATTSGPIKLIGMADVFENKIKPSHDNLKEIYGDKVDVPAERRFSGFDAYKQAIDLLKPSDVAIFTTPPAFRYVHFTYAIEKGVNVFMEKPVSVDGPGARRMFKLGEESMKKGMKVGVGLMCRHCAARGELYTRIRNGEIGDIINMRAYRMQDIVASFRSEPVPKGESELLYQIKRFHSFLWLSGGAFNDFYIHHIDETCWMKDAWPVEAQALGGRHYRENFIDQNFDTYSVEYTFADGSKLTLDGRCIPGCNNAFASYAHGSKGLAVISEGGHSPAHPRIYKGQSATGAPQWAWDAAEPNPYRLEWEHLIKAIRNNTPYNEVKRGVQASLVTTMGRVAAHSGQVVTYDQMLNHPVELGPGIDKLTMSSASPLRADANGKYPVPMPGMNGMKEFA
ncbi:MAG: Gfo/Idh/MocA family oxidoreductase [Chthonomonadales bacterium]